MDGDPFVDPDVDCQVCSPYVLVGAHGPSSRVPPLTTMGWCSNITFTFLLCLWTIWEMENILAPVITLRAQEDWSLFYHLLYSPI